ncbi:MAG: hypothetical protein KDK91_32135 [Gammaproteobacteria bacterium]|nr:hypothetical protein [Gammaproteobacteria bacterium]
MLRVITFVAVYALCVGSLGLVASLLDVPQPDLLALAACTAGAVLFLLAKLFWLDAPLNLDEAVSLTVVHDPRVGRLYSLWSPQLESNAPRMFRGLRAMEAALGNPKFEGMALHTALTASGATDLQRFRPLIAELVEFALIEWLKSTDLTPGYAELGRSAAPATGAETQDRASGPTARQVRSAPSIELVSTPVEVPEHPERRLLKIVRPVLGLPANSRVVLGSEYGAIDLSTRHSSMSVRMTGGGYERYSRPANRAGYRLQAVLDTLGVERAHESFPIVIHRFRLELKARQSRLTGYSAQAGSERRWLQRLGERLPVDFGFERLLGCYALPD